MRNLTDDDVEALASKVIEQMKTDFYKGVGQGVWGLIKKALLPFILLIAVYGMTNSKDVFSAIIEQHGAK